MCVRERERERGEGAASLSIVGYSSDLTGVASLGLALSNSLNSIAQCSSHAPILCGGLYVMRQKLLHNGLEQACMQ